MQIIPPEIERYAADHTTQESPRVRDLVARSDEELQYIDMLSGKIVGQLLAILVRISGAKSILEIGTFTGYSALRIAEALPEDGSLITCEYNERYEAIAREGFEESPYGHKIMLRMGMALETIETLNQQFDFIFLDADKGNYPAYYRAVIPKLISGGLLVIDNVLWEGKVLKPDDSKTRAIDELNNIIANDARVEQVMLTVRDGVTIVRKL